jgi:hypothetical protein
VKTFWLIVSAVCGVVALYFAYHGNYENAFVAAALGGVAWFLNYRVHLKQKLKDNEQEAAKNHKENSLDTE